MDREQRSMTPAPASAAEVVEIGCRTMLDLDNLWSEAIKDRPDLVPSDIRQLIGECRHLRAQLAEAEAAQEEIRQQLITNTAQMKEAENVLRREDVARKAAEARATAAEAELAEAQTQRHAFALELRIVQDTLFAKLDALKASDARLAAMREVMRDAAKSIRRVLDANPDAYRHGQAELIAAAQWLSAGAQPGEDWK